MAKPKITILCCSTYGTSHVVVQEAAAAMERPAQMSRRGEMTLLSLNTTAAH